MNANDLPSENRDCALETLKLFRIIFKSASRHFHDIEKMTGIGGASLWALAEIAETESLTVSGLARAMSIHQSTASNLIEKMHSNGYVARSRNSPDRRIVTLSLTEKGLDALQKAPPPYRGILPDALMRLNPAALGELTRHLTELVANMERKQDDSAFEPLGKS